MKHKGLKKTPQCSWININRQIHVFLTTNKSHAQTEEIYSILSWEMKVVGCLLNRRFVLNSMKQEKEIFFFYNSEKLTISFGLLNTSPRTTV